VNVRVLYENDDDSLLPPPPDEMAVWTRKGEAEEASATHPDFLVAGGDQPITGMKGGRIEEQTSAKRAKRTAPGAYVGKVGDSVRVGGVEDPADLVKRIVDQAADKCHTYRDMVVTPVVDISDSPAKAKLSRSELREKVKVALMDENKTNTSRPFDRLDRLVIAIDSSTVILPGTEVRASATTAAITREGEAAI
jgi:hypothetical protein